MFRQFNRLSPLLFSLTKIQLVGSPHHFDKSIFHSVIHRRSVRNFVPKVTKICPPNNENESLEAENNCDSYQQNTSENSCDSGEKSIDFKQIFEGLDSDQDGSLTPEEMKQALKCSLDFLTDKHLNTILGSGKGSQEYCLDDFLDSIESITKQKNLVEETLYYMFLLNDFDKDKKLEVEDVARLMDDMMGSKDKTDDEKVMASVMKYDEDCDCCLTIEDVKKLLWAEYNPFEC